MSRRQGLKWRVSYDACDQHHTRIHVEDGGDFDELVLDKWLHLERMDKRAWWMQLGDCYVWIQIGENGQATVNVRRGEYDGAGGRTEWLEDGRWVERRHAAVPSGRPKTKTKKKARRR